VTRSRFLCLLLGAWVGAAGSACEPQGPASAAIMQVVAPTASPSPVSPPPPDPGGAEAAPGLSAPPGSLDALYGALHAAEARAPGARAGIVAFGDSHTAGDALTGRLRTVLQDRFGDGGRGFVLAGKPPVRHYYQRQIRYGSEGRWLAELGGRRDASEPFGLGGVRVHGDDRGARAWVETCDDCPSSGRVGRFDVYYLRTPASGRLAYRIDDGGWKKLPTRSPSQAQPDVLSIPVQDGPHRLTLRPGGGGAVELFGVALEREQPGVVVDSVGVVGRRLAHLVSWDWSVIGRQLERRDPRLVILQYGTNEAEESDLDLGLLARRYDEAIARVRAAAPRASILILGPPDMARRPGGALCSEAAPPRPQPPRVTGPGVPATALAGGDPRVGIDPLTGAAVPPECRWLTPARLPSIVEVQRHAAERAGVAFFDSLAAMGGADRMDLFFHLDPPLAYSDRVHFTTPGYEQWADLLLAELLAGYDAWKQRAEHPR
jgi:lysophospholipase L1-like esterase